MADNVKRNLIPVGIVAYLILLSFHAGALENRVYAMERQQAINTEKIDRLLTMTSDIRIAVARLEAREEKKR